MRGQAGRAPGVVSWPRGAAPPAVTADLLARQRARLMLDEHRGLTTRAQAGAFLAEVAIALRYGATESLPLASMYQATRRSVPTAEPERDAQRRATVLTNALIDDATAIETSVIADRIALAHASLVPALIALRRRGAAPDELALSDAARRALAFVRDADRPTAGQVRAHLGVPPRTWPNPADDALAELQRHLLVDRGAAEVPETGSPYLSRDGIPYRIFDRTHAALVARAAKLAIADAARQLIAAYLAGAIFARRGKLASMFKHCLSRAELDAAIATLVAQDRVAIDNLDGKQTLVAVAVAAGRARR